MSTDIESHMIDMMLSIIRDHPGEKNRAVKIFHVFFQGMSKGIDNIKQIFGDWRCQLCLLCNLFIAVIHFMD